MLSHLTEVISPVSNNDDQNLSLGFFKILFTIKLQGDRFCKLIKTILKWRGWGKVAIISVHATNRVCVSGQAHMATGHQGMHSLGSFCFSQLPSHPDCNKGTFTRLEENWFQSILLTFPGDYIFVSGYTASQTLAGTLKKFNDVCRKRSSKFCFIQMLVT